MINTYDVRNQGRLCDVILNSLNGMHDRKSAGALDGQEFANIIVNTGDLLANGIKLGKIKDEDIESVESYLTQFLGENCNNYFDHPHQDLSRAGKTALESIDFAREELEKRSQFSQPVMDVDSYTKTFRKLGS